MIFASLCAGLLPNPHLTKLPTCLLIFGKICDGHGHKPGVHCLAPKELHKRTKNLELGSHELDNFVAVNSQAGRPWDGTYL